MLFSSSSAVKINKNRSRQIITVKIPPNTAKCFSFISCRLSCWTFYSQLIVLWSFYWNNKFVFEKADNEERNIVHALIKTYISYAFTGLFLNSILSLLWVEVLGIPKIIAPIINLLVSVPLNFIMNKFWAFRKSEK